jgi:hypothetical protein
MYVVQAGLLDGDPGIRPDAVIWWDEHAPWFKNLDALDKLGEGMGSVVREPARPGFTGEYCALRQRGRLA